MATTEWRLTFEQPMYDLQQQIADLEAAPEKSPESHDKIRQLRRELAERTQRQEEFESGHKLLQEPNYR